VTFIRASPTKLHNIVTISGVGQMSYDFTSLLLVSQAQAQMACFNVDYLWKYDRENKTWMTKSELLSALLLSGGSDSLAVRHVNDYFNLADRYILGKVLLTEFIAEYTRMANFKTIFYMERNLHLLNDNDDGVVDRQDLLPVLEKFIGATSAQAHIDNICREMDSDHSNTLTIQEIKSWYQSSEQQVRAQQHLCFSQNRLGHLPVLEAGYVVVRVMAARGLYDDDSSVDNGQSEAYVEVTVGDATLRTRKSQSWSWNEVFTFSVSAGCLDVAEFALFDSCAPNPFEPALRLELSIVTPGGHNIPADSKDGTRERFWRWSDGELRSAGSFGELQCDISFASARSLDVSDSNALRVAAERSASLSPASSLPDPAVFAAAARSDSQLALDEAAGLLDTGGENSDGPWPGDSDGEGDVADRNAKGNSHAAHGLGKESVKDSGNKSGARSWPPSVLPPSALPKPSLSAPDRQLELEWVYGLTPSAGVAIATREIARITSLTLFITRVERSSPAWVRVLGGHRQRGPRAVRSRRARGGSACRRTHAHSSLIAHRSAGASGPGRAYAKAAERAHGARGVRGRAPSPVRRGGHGGGDEGEHGVGFEPISRLRCVRVGQRARLHVAAGRRSGL
jgi:hypothetical protein